MAFLANCFGYLLNALYELFNNYGLAIILFSIIIKLLFLPISIKQEKTMRKTARIQEKMKQIQFKYKNNPEKLNQETIELYKTEKMNPFSGCLSGILQLVLFIAIFYLVKSPLTHMKKVDSQIIENYTNEIKQEDPEKEKMAYPEIDIIQLKGKDHQEVYINMDFLGIDLSTVPTQNLNDPKTYVIPILYVLSSFISMRISTKMQKEKEKKVVLESGKEDDDDNVDTMLQMNKTMSYMMPIMAISISIIAPLGLALYWFMNNILMIIERLVLKKFIKSEEEESNA